MIVEAKIVWISSSSLEVRLPEVQVGHKDDMALLPFTNLRLSKFADGARVSARHSDTDEPAEWKSQPFYPRVRGKFWASESASWSAKS